MSKSVLNQRLNYLAIADMDYLAARSLMLSGNPFCGMPKAAEALEKIMKLFLILETKISRNEELSAKDLKKYSHNLIKLSKKVESLCPMQLDEHWKNYLEKLQKSYHDRYPDNWANEMEWSSDIDNLDAIYAYLRLNISSNFPLEEVKVAKSFGVNILPAYNDEIVRKIEEAGMLSPIDLLSKHNKQIDKFNVP